MAVANTGTFNVKTTVMSIKVLQYRPLPLGLECGFKKLLKSNILTLFSWYSQNIFLMKYLEYFLRKSKQKNLEKFVLNYV